MFVFGEMFASSKSSRAYLRKLRASLNEVGLVLLKVWCFVGSGGSGGRGGCVESAFSNFITVTFSALGRNHTVSQHEKERKCMCVVYVVRCVVCTVLQCMCVVLYCVFVLRVACGMRVVCGVVWRLPNLRKAGGKEMQKTRFGT